MQALLKLDHIESIRKSLKSAQTKACDERRRQLSERETAESALQQHLGLGCLRSHEVISQLNQRRCVLGLAPLSSLAEQTDFLEGAKVAGESKTFNLVAARRTIETAASSLEAGAAQPAYEILARKRDEIKRIDADVVTALRHRDLLETGLRAVTSEACPLCGLIWNTWDELVAHLRSKIEATRLVEQARSQLETAARSYDSRIRVLREAATQVKPIVEYLDIGDGAAHLIDHWTQGLSRLEGASITAEGVMVDAYPSGPAIHELPQRLIQILDETSDALANMPDETDISDARSFLDIAKDRWGRVKLARSSAVQATAVTAAVSAAYAAYCQAGDDALTALYKTVEEDFSRFYQYVNSDDEATFKAKFSPASGSLDLKMDFYQLGMFPSAAYHSEGHQDGMGVCLYHALVKQLLGSEFRYAVLDDVVMSVDTNHRRRFADLLKNEFADVQFIITTHDELWARQMKTVGLVTKAATARFLGWTVDGGPQYGAIDSWQTIRDVLLHGDVPGAAARLRRFMEASTADIAESIGASLAYKGDQQHTLGEFIQSLNSRIRELLDKAGSAAKARNDTEQQAEVTSLLATRSDAISERDAESWLINNLVHNNNWVNASVADFLPVLEASEKYPATFQCAETTCESWLVLRGGRLTCGCGSFSLNMSHTQAATSTGGNRN